MSDKIAIIGTGLVGRAWSVVFARAGLSVSLYDPADGAVEATLSVVDQMLPGLEEVGLLSGQTSESVRSNMQAADGLSGALDGAVYVQESGPERVEVKQDIHRQIDQLAPPTAVVASSTSGIPASSFTEDLAHRRRCLVAHPINPPHIVPLVEVVPAPWTEPKAVSFTQQLMRRVGQSPIQLNKEVNGFVVNRLQGALLGEAFRLVEDGVCGVADVDAAIADGLGLRWSFIGPFETIDLNSPRGVRGYCDMLGSLYYELAQEQADPREWTEPLVQRVDQERRRDLPMPDLPDRQAWRDKWLARLVVGKRDIAQELGD